MLPTLRTDVNSNYKMRGLCASLIITDGCWTREMEWPGGPWAGFQALPSALQYQNLDLPGLLDPERWGKVEWSEAQFQGLWARVWT